MKEDLLRATQAANRRPMPGKTDPTMRFRVGAFLAAGTSQEDQCRATHASIRRQLPGAIGFIFKTASAQGTSHFVIVGEDR